MTSFHGRIDEEAYGSLAQVVKDKEEVKSMLLKALEREKAKIREEAKEEGKEEGMEAGIEAGIDLRNQQIVRNMLAKGYAISVIADLTGLSEEWIHNFRQSIAENNSVASTK